VRFFWGQRRSAKKIIERMMLSGLRSMFIVYDADGTVCGEIIYHVRKMLFNATCSACSITHGPKKEKPEFTQLKGEFSIPVYNIHRDEMDVELRAVATSLPCVAVEQSDGKYELLLSPEELDRANGSVDQWEQLMKAKLVEKGFAYDMSQTKSEDSHLGDARVPSFRA